MKNLISFLTVATFLFFTSCTKEAILQPEAAIDANVESLLTNTDNLLPELETEVTFEAGDNATVAVSVTASSIEGNNLVANFSADYDFTNAVLAGTQTLSFTNGSTLTFAVNNYLGGDGALQVTYAIGGNNIDGLGLEVSQGIVIEDITMD